MLKMPNCASVQLSGDSTSQTNISNVCKDSSVIWDAIKNKLQARYGDAIYRSWIKPVTFITCSSSCVTLSTPTRFIKQWVSSHYLQDILNLWQLEVPDIIDIEIIVVESANHKSEESSTSTTTEAPKDNNIEFLSKSINLGDGWEDEVGAPLDSRFLFENFVVGKPNELAYAAALRVAESGTAAPHANPLFLYGGVGLGKTHLMHAIAWHIRKNSPDRKVVYLSAEKFMYQFVNALRHKEAMSFKSLFRSVDVLMIDDVQFISGKDNTQEEFFHTFNTLVDQNKQIVLSGDRSPSDLEGVEERIKSRLGWGLVVDIHATTYELRLGILQNKAEKCDMEVPGDVMEFIAHNITSNIRELEGALNKVIAYSSLVGKPITLDAAHEVLKDLIRSNSRRLTIELIQKKVAEHFNIKMSDMHSSRRSRSVARPRQIAMYLAKNLTSKSLPEIGRKFGGKDHTTVMHAVKRIDELCNQDATIAEDVYILTRILQN